MKIYFSSKFLKSFRKLPDKIKRQAEIKIKTFKNNYNEPGLKTHGLKGDLEGFFSFSINYSYRIIFKFDGEDVTLINVGTHGIYK